MLKFLAVGRLVEAKDYPNLISAFSILHKGIPSARLCIVGDGPLRNAMESLVNDLGLTQSVQFLGIRDDIPALMNAADFCSFFSLGRLWPGCCGGYGYTKIVIATDCGGVAEVLGGHGILVKPKNSQMLADAMCAAISLDKVKAQDMVCAARAWVIDHYSIDGIVQEWVKVYGMNFKDAQVAN